MKDLRERLARAIHPDAFGTLGAIRPDSIAVANEAADAALSVLASYLEDEAVVERAARAMWEVDFSPGYAPNDPTRESYIEAARAALAAVREG
jgi:hypothetical protein